MAVSILSEKTHPKELTIEALRDRTIAVLGYGNQGSAHALNLRESGLRVIVGNRPGTENARRARDAGFEVVEIGDAARSGDLVIVALPDEAHREVWESEIAPHARAGQVFGFLHGFSVHFGFVQPPPDVGVALIAPKGPGSLLRSLYVEGKGLPCLFAVAQDPRGCCARETALAWAAGIGSGRAAVIETTFAAEAVTDLFGEQAVLCGGVLALARAAFRTLVEAGYEPELAYLECCHELKQVVDLLYERGFAGVHEAISNTAEFGAFEAAEDLESAGIRTAMEGILKRIHSGDFARSMLSDADAGSPALTSREAALRSSDLEKAGAAVRSWMPWLMEGRGRAD